MTPKPKRSPSRHLVDLVAQTLANWNQIRAYLQQISALREVFPAISNDKMMQAGGDHAVQ
jgi:hypothetical protein